MSVLCCAPFHPLCELTKYPIIGTALSPTLTMGMLTIGPGDSEVLFSPATDADPLRSGPRTVVIIYVPEPAVGGVGAVEAAQTLAWPNPCSVCPQSLQQLKPAHPSCRSTCCPFRCLQVLNLGSCQWRCNSEVHTEARRDFSSTSSSHGPLGSAVVSAPPLFVCLLSESTLEIAWAHKPIRPEGTEVVIRVRGPPRQEDAGIATGK